MESYSKKNNSGSRQSRRSMGILSMDLEASDNKYGKLGFVSFIKIGYFIY